MVLIKNWLASREAQAKLALIVSQIYLSVHPSVCPSVCPRQLVMRMYTALRVASHLDYRLVYLFNKTRKGIAVVC